MVSQRRRSSLAGVSKAVPRRFPTGITLDEADESSVVSLVFQHEPERFGFTPSRRTLLINGIDPRSMPRARPRLASFDRQ